MRTNLNKMNIKGNIVIGEGEMDEAPMLYIGEKLGTLNGPKFDIAVDPLEGTNFVANNKPNAFSMLAVCEKGNLLSAPDTYMEKIAIGSNLPKNLVDLDNTVEKNISLLAEAKKTTPNKLTVCILDRPRHSKILSSLNKMNVKLKLITDGDVSGALMVTDDKYNVDIFLGIGGGPEGVLAASALDTYGCKFQGRFLFENEKDISRAKKMGITDLNKKYDLKEIIKGDSIFCATGITAGDLVKGINVKDSKYITETLVTHKSSNTCKIVTREDTIKTW